LEKDDHWRKRITGKRSGLSDRLQE
jgi:hypothetical protein